ncbi:MAG: hypothetical protein LIP01_01965 [Tannerellaceae bacterium]|nr:hypothetical protein [Tannerellaceae bacterium]
MIRKKIYTLVLSILVLLSACMDERNHYLPQPEVATQDIYLQIRVPGLSAPGTRALSALDENYIETLDILVFKKDPVSSEETYAYQTVAYAIEGNTGTSTLRTFSLSLQASEGTEEYRIVLLANLRDEITATTFTVGESKENTLKKITFDASDVWDTTTPPAICPCGERVKTLTL